MSESKIPHHIDNDVRLVTDDALPVVAFSRWKKFERWMLCCFSRKKEEGEVDEYEVPLSVIANDATRREFICAGASAGIAVSPE